MKTLCALAAIVVAAISVVAAQPARRAIALVVSGGTVVTQNATHQILSPGAVAIDGTDIVEVGDVQAIAAKYQARETVDARGQMVLPGLINTHTHARWSCIAAWPTTSR